MWETFEGISFRFSSHHLIIVMGKIKETYVKLPFNKDPLSTSLSCSVLMKSIVPGLEEEKRQLSDVQKCFLFSFEMSFVILFKALSSDGF